MEDNFVGVCGIKDAIKFISCIITALKICHSNSLPVSWVYFNRTIFFTFLLFLLVKGTDANIHLDRFLLFFTHYELKDKLVTIMTKFVPQTSITPLISLGLPYPLPFPAILAGWSDGKYPNGERKKGYMSKAVVAFALIYRLQNSVTPIFVVIVRANGNKYRKSVLHIIIWK